MKTTTIIILSVILFLTQSCKKHEKLMLVETLTISEINATGGIATAKIIDVGETGVVSHGWCWSENQNPEINDTKNDLGEINKPSDFSCNINGLLPDETYYARPYVTGNGETVYGNEMKIETQPLIFNISSPEEGVLVGKTTTHIISWTVNINDKLKIELYKGGTNNLLLRNNLENNGSYSWTIPNTLPDGIDYKIKITSENNEIIFAETNFFTILSEAPPTVKTDLVSNLSYFTATIEGSIENFGTKAEATQHGHCWSTIENPTITNDKTELGSTNTIGNFSSDLTNLQENTTYYVRAYATNSVGTSYGEQKILTTFNAAEPTVITNVATNISYFTVTCSGDVTNDNGYTVTAKGLCWSTSQNPTISNIKTNNGTGTGSFSSNLTNLSENTTYYVRAYATNSIGTSYGEEKTFTTLVATLPVLTTSTVLDIDYSTAICGGNITNQGDGNVTARGICWSTSQNPTIENDKITNGTGEGNYTSNITNLNAKTTYYIRAYAENSVGVAYGEERTFTTLNLFGELIDYDGNIYNTIQIGSQTWMAENLKAIHYSDGTAIPLVADRTVWIDLIETDKAYTYYDNSDTNKEIYGPLYTWAAAMNGEKGSDAGTVQGTQCYSGLSRFGY